MKINKKIQWSLAIYLLLGIIYSFYYFIRYGFENSFFPSGILGAKIFISNVIFFPFVLITKDIIGIHFRVELWWYLLLVFVVVGLIIELIYKFLEFEIKFLRLHKVIKHTLILVVFFALIFLFNMPMQQSVKYEPLETINYKDIIQNLNQINQESNQSFSVGFSFPISYYTEDELEILAFKENYSKYDIMKYEFEKEWIIKDDFDYYGVNSSKLRQRYKFSDLSVEEIHNIWEENDKIKQEQREFEWQIRDSEEFVVPYQEKISVFVVSSAQTSAINRNSEAGNHTFGFFSFDNGSSLYLNYDLLANGTQNDSFNSAFENTMTHEITHYFYLTGKLGTKSELAKLYKLDYDKIETYQQPIEKELEQREKEGTGGYFTISFYSPEWIKTQDDLMYYINLRENKAYDIEEENLRDSINFTGVYQWYGADNYDDEIIARINGLCIGLDENNNYNSVKINDYEICKEFDFPQEYLDLYDTFIQEFVMNYYQTFIERKKYQEIININMEDQYNTPVTITIEIVDEEDEDGE